jgi:hypothetical protein
MLLFLVVYVNPWKKYVVIYRLSNHFRDTIMRMARVVVYGAVPLPYVGALSYACRHAQAATSAACTL